MTTVLSIPDPVRLILLAPAPAPRLAVALLCRNLAITPDQALHRLGQTAGPLACGLRRSEASRLAALLSVLGLRVRLERDDLPAAAGPLVDLSLQPAAGIPLAALARCLADLLDRSDGTLLADLQRPGGVIVPRCPAGQVERIRRGTRRIKGLLIAQVCPDQALHDLFARPGARLSGGLMRHLALLGLRPCPFNAALASGVDRRTRDHVTARFGDAVFGLEQSFQRLDLYVSGSGGLSALELSDFLATRRSMGCGPAGQPPFAPQQIETGLSHADARQFQRDYDTIGLQTLARISQPGLAAENR